MVPRQNKDRELVLYFIDKKEKTRYTVRYIWVSFSILNFGGGWNLGKMRMFQNNIRHDSRETEYWHRFDYIVGVVQQKRTMEVG